jgi:predicted RNA methylase
MGWGFGLGALLLLLWSSLFGKFRARDALLNAVPWRGDEQVLDVGCGHGLMLIGAAKPGGHVAIFDVRHAHGGFFERNGFTIVKKWTTMLFGRSVVARKNQDKETSNPAPLG